MDAVTRFPVLAGLGLALFIVASVLLAIRVFSGVQAESDFDAIDALASDAREEAQVELDEMMEARVTPEPPTPAPVVFGDQFPEVLAVEATLVNNDNWNFSVTLSSPYDSPERYADAWRVVDDLGRELGVRVLGHDHANEQPFTRSHTIQVPRRLRTVFVEGRDQDNGWSGQRFEFTMP